MLHALGILLAQTHQLQAAQEKIERAIACNPNQFSYHNSLGNVFLQSKKYDMAEKSYKKAIKLNPHYAIAYNNLGNIYLYNQKLTAAKQAYEKAIKLKTDYADAYCNLGILQAGLSDDENAIVSLEKSLTLNATLIKAQAQLADLYLRHQQYAKARDLFLTCREKYPENIDFLHGLGVTYFYLREFEKANTIFESVLIHNHKHPEVNQYLANTLLEMGDHEKAMHYYYRQLEIEPKFETYYNVGVLLMMKERLKESLHYFEQALQLQPTDLATHLNCGNIYLKRNEIDQAIAHYQKADAIKPNDPEIQHILSALKQQNTENKAPAPYIIHLFNQYAAYYDKHLTEYLKYNVPQKLFDAIQLENPTLSEKEWQIMDLGCGTGLCGSLFKSFAKKLIGVDLSTNMLTVARQKNIYDELIEEDIVSCLDRFSSLDLIIAADVLTYIGDLLPLFSGVENALKRGGLFIFTVEKTYENNFILQTSIRYAHNKHYLELCANACHLDVLRIDNVVLREQKKEPIEGYLVLLRRKICL